MNNWLLFHYYGKKKPPKIVMSDNDGSDFDHEYEEYLTFAEIFQSQSIATHVTSYLDIKDTNTVIKLFGKQFNYIIEDKLFNVFTRVWDCKNIKIKNILPETPVNLLDTDVLQKDNVITSEEKALDINIVNFFDKIKNEVNECTYKELLSIYLAIYVDFDAIFKFSHSNNRNLNKIETWFPKEKYNTLDIAQIILNCLEFAKSIEIYDHVAGTEKLENLNFLKELFVNECLTKLHNTKNDETVSRETILALLKMNENLLLMDYYKSLNDVQIDVLKDFGKGNLFIQTDNISELKVNTQSFEELFNNLLAFWNKKCKEADTLFDADLPLIFVNYMEEAIGDTLLEWSKSIFDSQNTFVHFEYFYRNLLIKVISKIETNGANSYGRAVMLKNLYGFIKLYYSNDIQEYLTQQISDNNKEVTERLLNFEKVNNEQLNKENENFLNEKLNEIKKKKDFDELEDNINNNSKKNKSNFLRSFQHMLKLGSNSETNQEKEELEIEYNLKKLENDIGNIKNLIDLPLCIEVIQLSSNRINNIMSFLEVYSKLNIEITKEEFDLNEKSCEMIYEDLLTNIDTLHLSKAFERSLKLLIEYDIDVVTENDSIIGPLSNFSELINVSDIILQLLQMFYKNDIENISKKIPNQVNKKKTFDFLNQLVIKKKNFELKIDDYVANGLNTGITKLMQQIEYIYTLNQSPKDYCPDEKNVTSTVSTCCEHTVNLLKIHCTMISQSLANKATLEVYNQEITERLFQFVLKNLKKNIVNVEGGKNLINDLKYYLKFIENDLKMKKMNALFKSLINVSEIYTIDFSEGEDEENEAKETIDKTAKKKKYTRYKTVSKDIAKRICNPSLFLGVFTQDEVYELVGRRIDWYNIKPFVDKAVYGLDCVIC